jgi:hypothetical protein
MHQRLIDQRMLNVVLVLVLTTATLGPVLTQYFAPRMLEASRETKPASPGDALKPVELGCSAGAGASVGIARISSRSLRKVRSRTRALPLFTALRPL